MHLKNDNKSMNTIHFDSGTSFNNEYNIRQHIIILRLGLLGIYIEDNDYNCNERVQWHVMAYIAI